MTNQDDNVLTRTSFAEHMAADDSEVFLIGRVLTSHTPAGNNEMARTADLSKAMLTDAVVILVSVVITAIVIFAVSVTISIIIATTYNVTNRKHINDIPSFPTIYKQSTIDIYI